MLLDLNFNFHIPLKDRHFFMTSISYLENQNRTYFLILFKTKTLAPIGIYCHTHSCSTVSVRC